MKAEEYNKKHKFKFSLYDYLLDGNNILSHVFLESADKIVCESIAAKNEGLSDEKIKKRKIEIELKIDGYNCNPEKFFDMIYEQYVEQVKDEAKKFIQQNTTDKLEELEDKIYSIKESVDYLTDEVVDNLDFTKFIKK